ncbi:hypothetical protein ABIC32_002405 [Brevundimonas sp. 1080]|uniref:hypothetical protein n=1 Tax=Brevundimonas sp. 1080 TaxID=3156405 RepID=UPI0018ED73D6
MTPRRLTGLQQRAIDRAIAGGHHRVSISADGEVVILPIDVSPDQGSDDALDAEIREHLSRHGDAAH